MDGAYPCVCCGYLTRDTIETGSFDICPVCGWEDDNVQARLPDSAGGANKVSLSEAKENFKEFCAKDRQSLRNVRSPRADEWPKLT